MYVDRDVYEDLVAELMKKCQKHTCMYIFICNIYIYIYTCI
jgi:hypothetical protein